MSEQDDLGVMHRASGLESGVAPDVPVEQMESVSADLDSLTGGKARPYLCRIIVAVDGAKGTKALQRLDDIDPGKVSEVKNQVRAGEGSK